jgi:iron-sulfur cluster assembly protein
MITLTDKAVKEIKRVMEDLPEVTNSLLRVGVAGGGCSGFEYKLGFVEQSEYSEKTHNKYEHDGLAVIVEKKAEPFIDGTTIDWIEELSKRGFAFNNPNAARSCGSCECGESFSV